MKQPRSIWEFEKFGTNWSIETDRPLSEATRRTISRRLELFDRSYSRFRDDSLVTSMKKRTGLFSMPSDFSALFHFYENLYSLTDGKVTPLIGEMLEQAGYDSTYSLTSKGDFAELPKLSDVFTFNNETKMATVTQPITLDFGAAGKGYAVDIIAEIIEKEVDQYTIDASGDMRHRGSVPERVGLEHPADPTKVIGVMGLKNRSLCASASNRRAWRGMHHIMDPTARKSVDTVVATWVVADDTLHADGIATALFFMKNPEVLQETFSFDFVRMFHDGVVDYSPGFEGELFI
ncbi:MAG TPA: FAD:protein FMN transferase [Candidatus Saccharimonadales bacterium]|nr:FAD:protein FMN transferase [Candidatus Saccharimonadales bacterium]